uniref:Uncharacterized protein n=1 Tax=Anguilla anguilla TaxID=7936 RepID=A0A0E9Q640_ANGAN
MQNVSFVLVGLANIVCCNLAWFGIGAFGGRPGFCKC